MLSFRTNNAMRSLVYVALLLFVSSGHLVCDAKHHRKVKDSTPPPNDSKNDDSEGNTIDVMDHGAVGNGETDSTQAFAAAWALACGKPNGVLLVPSGDFLVQPMSFAWNTGCVKGTVFKVIGNIVAHPASGWKTKATDWLNFQNVQGLRIEGGGRIDGQGATWWPNGGTRPTAVRLADCNDVTVTDITILNSPQVHLKFDNCVGVAVTAVTISSPGNSPNTDGIHLQNSVNVHISNCEISCGDDNISIQTGCSNVIIKQITGKLGHGIGIGSLGKGGTAACVSGITVSDSTLSKTMTGVRIKTWQGGSGTVRNVSFTNIKVADVATPLVIDQFYGDSDQSSTESSSSGAVHISGITFAAITGTYMTRPVSLKCASSGCNDLILSGIHLSASQGAKDEGPLCTDAYGKQTDSPFPCLQSGGKKSYSSSSYGDSC